MFSEELVPRPVPRCRVLRIAAPRSAVVKWVPLFLYIDRIPKRLPRGMVIVYAYPVPSLVVPTTSVSFVEKFELEFRELETNYHVILKHEDGAEHYVYPKKVWELVADKYIEPLKQGRSPAEPGVLLYGPPGTGKTSMMELMALGLGLHVVDIDPGHVLSKWVGESEQRLLNKLKEAEEMEPSIVRIDDAEWLVRRRDLAAAADTPATYLTMLSILLQKIPQWKRERRRCLAAVATNVSPSAIDPALMRSGRLGKPIFIPLPDYEAILTILKVKGLKEGKAEELAKKLLALGANMADVVAAAQDVLEGKEPRLEEIPGRGYSRPFFTVELPDDWFPVKVARKALEHYDRRIRLWVQLEEPVALPVAVSLAYSCARGAVVLEDPRYVDEAVLTAEVARSVLVIPTSMAEHVKFVHASSKAPIIYAGMDAPPGKAFPIVSWNNVSLSNDAVKAVVEATLKFYGIRCGEKVMEKALRMSRQSLRELLSTLPCLLAGSELTEEELQWWR